MELANSAQQPCHPEARRRRGTSQALTRFRVTSRVYVSLRVTYVWVIQFPGVRSLRVYARRDDNYTG